MKFTDYLEKVRQDPEYRKAEEELALAFDLADAVLCARLKAGLSQTELARRVGTKQANISRIESGLANPTLDLVNRLMQVLGFKVKFEQPFSIQNSTESSVDYSLILYTTPPYQIPYQIRNVAIHQVAEKVVSYG
jgi:ribosome-binding protein aMBF1 (putative translation factor)